MKNSNQPEAPPKRKFFLHFIKQVVVINKGQHGKAKTNLLFIRAYRPEWALFLLLAFLHLSTGCSFYKVAQDPWGTADMQELQQAEKYFILHEGENVWHLDDIRIDQENGQVHGRLEPVPDDHLYYLKTKPEAATPYKPKRGDPTAEVHLYCSPLVGGADSAVLDSAGSMARSIPFSTISRIEVYEFAKGASTAATFGVFLSVVAGVAVIIGLIYALTKSSCPFVYIADGDGYRFVGEMYGGAIRPGLERDDYMPLPGFKPREGQYTLKITNELKERQYTNLADLIVIDHPEGTKVLMDEYGQAHSIARPQAPTTVLSDNMTDYRQAISTLDSSWMMFNDDPAVDRDMSSLTMTFDRPADAKTGKLVLHAKNSLWLDYIFGKFTEQMGTYYPTFQEKQRAIPGGKQGTWARDQGLSLSVWLKSGREWVFVDDFPMVGPLASRDLVMPVDLGGIKGNDVTIKMTCGFMFWEVDYAAMDFSAGQAVSMTAIQPLTATDELGQDVRAPLLAADTAYLVQPQAGNEALIVYAAPAVAPDMTRSAFLHSRGYYEYIRAYTNEPNLGYVKTFKKQGAFTKFSKERYNEQLAREDLWAAQNTQTHEK